uniref:SecY-type transporter protein n=1 Tax=Reclinomonas americana ATCC 50633 TaxID=1295593 RepID=M4QCN3_RECAM|nr:SecY-type transporter protein [Reclinomonas americana ATCC 50633]
MFDRKEISSRILFTFFIIFLLFVFRNITLPGIELEILTKNIGVKIIDITNIVNGNAKFSMLGLSITPIITCLLIQQLIYIFSSLNIFTFKSKNIYFDRNHFDKYFIYYFILISYVEGIIYLKIINNTLMSPFLQDFLFDRINYFVCVTSLVLGSFILYSFAKLINIYGIGKGLSLIIFVNIINTLMDVFYRYCTQLPSNYIYIIFVQCFLCSLIYFYVDTLFVKISIVKLDGFFCENSNYNYLSFLDRYRFLSLSLAGILPILLVNSFIYFFKVNIVSYGSIFFNFIIEILLMLLLYVFLSRVLKRFIKYVYLIGNNNIYIENIENKKYLFLFLSDVFFKIFLRDYCCLCFILLFSKLIFIGLYFFNFFEDSMFLISDMNLLLIYETNNTFMFLYLIFFRILILIFYRIKYLMVRKELDI